MIEISKTQNIDDVLFFTLLIAGVVVALLRYVYPRMFNRDVLSLFTLGDTPTDEPHRASRGEMTYGVISSLLYVYVLSIILYLWWYRNSVGYSPIFTDWLVVFGVGIALLVMKWAVDKFLFWVFDVEDIAAMIGERIIAMRLSIVVWGGGLFFMMWYAMKGFNMVISDVWVVILLGIGVLLYLLKMGEFLMRGKAYFLFFIFYLCTIQICPIILAWIWVKNVLTT